MARAWHPTNPSLRKTVLRVGGLALTLGLFACGQVSTSVFTPSEPSLAVADVASKADGPPAGYSVDDIYSELERMMARDCDRQVKAIGNLIYTLCTVSDAEGQLITLSASSALTPEGDGVAYWFRSSGELYAVEYLHTGEILVLVPAGQQTIIELVPQQDLQVITDAARWQALTSGALEAVADIQTQIEVQAQLETRSDAAVEAGPPMALVKVAREGGDPHHRWVTFEVPQAVTSSSAWGGALRWYDAHLATMVALTADQFCGHQSARGAYFNYEADGGSIFMGQIFVSCSVARSVIETYGQGQYAWVVLEEAWGDAESLDQWVPDLPDTMVPQFRQTVVQQLTPECIETGGTRLCPGDRI
ncbi:hypothetical protein [Nodosilinea sp. E11]|uniref:hypothetical protein n=1 Tax=Nodosilinea sp. E11 TaxID=3037479 RepID=UPI0029350B84|nr:hypothetical protein [Nodosilinea sp. E11]WOD41019.1 hypothetical protein RRF56_09455 [Nodosilinea sp. E11]